jgi:hypothetical protein
MPTTKPDRDLGAMATGKSRATILADVRKAIRDKEAQIAAAPAAQAASKQKMFSCAVKSKAAPPVPDPGAEEEEAEDAEKAPLVAASPAHQSPGERRRAAKLAGMPTPAQTKAAARKRPAALNAGLETGAASSSSGLQGPATQVQETGAASSSKGLQSPATLAVKQEVVAEVAAKPIPQGDNKRMLAKLSYKAEKTGDSSVLDSYKAKSMAEKREFYWNIFKMNKLDTYTVEEHRKEYTAEVDKKKSDWCTPDRVAQLAGYSPGVENYEKKKLALIADLKVWRDHENPALAAMGERQYWHTWGQKEESEGTEKSTVVKGTGQIDEERHTKFAKHFDVREDCPTTSADTAAKKEAQIRIEEWKQKALVLQRRFSAMMLKASKMDTRTTTFILRLDRLKSQFPASVAHKTELVERQTTFDKARVTVATAEAGTSSKTEAKAVEQAKTMDAAIPIMQAAMKDYEKVLSCVYSYLDYVDN